MLVCPACRRVCLGVQDADEQARWPTPGGHRPQVALLDEGFVELWMRAACRCGQSARAEEIGQSALEAAGRHDKSADFKLRRLAERVRAEECPDGIGFGVEPEMAGQATRRQESPKSAMTLSSPPRARM